MNALATRPARDDAIRLGVAFVSGMTCAPAATMLGMPSDGTFMVVTWVAGLLAGLVAPGWRGWSALVAGVAVTTVALTSGAPLAFLILAMLVALVSHGALVGFVLSRTGRLGLTGAISDAVLRRAVLVAAILLVAYWLVAQDFARNPP